MKHIEQLRGHIQGISHNMRQVLARGVKTRRQDAAKHIQQQKQEARARREARKDLNLIMKEARKGVGNLVRVFRDQATQEAVDLYEKTHSKEIVIFERTTSFGHGMNFRASSCSVYMRPGGLYARVDQGLDSNRENLEHVTQLDDLTRSTSEGDVKSSVAYELHEFLSLYRGREDKWLVESVLSIDVLTLNKEEGAPGEDAPWASSGDWDKVYMAWLAFFVACADEKKLALLMEKAFQKLSETV
jgi:hypothetical protein